MNTNRAQFHPAARLAAGLLAGWLPLVAGCNFAPPYTKPSVPTAAAFKELTPAQFPVTDGWKTAMPGDDRIRGRWWEVFQQPELNALEEQITVTNNQTLAVALENYLMARDLVKETRTGYFPVISADPSGTVSRSNLRMPGTVGSVQKVESYTLPLQGSWQPDFWGSVRNSVKADVLEAQATLADLENTRLAMQGELAVDYYQLRELDSQKELLDATVHAYRDSLDLENVLHKTGIASDQDVAQAETQLNATLAQDTDLEMQRTLLEHAIATLVGKPASSFSLKPAPLVAQPAAVPPGVPYG